MGPIDRQPDSHVAVRFPALEATIEHDGIASVVPTDHEAAPVWLRRHGINENVSSAGYHGYWDSDGSIVRRRRFGSALTRLRPRNRYHNGTWCRRGKDRRQGYLTTSRLR